jgi:integrase
LTLSGKQLKSDYAYKIIKNACIKNGLTDGYATHSMRKYFSKNIYTYWDTGKGAGQGKNPLIKTSEALGHKSLDSTKHYLNFMFTGNDEAVKEIFSNINEELKHYAE